MLRTGLLVLVGLLLACGGRPAPRASDSPAIAQARPRIVTKSAQDDDLLAAYDWTLDSFPAVSRDGSHVATVWAAVSPFYGVTSTASPNFAEPDRVVEFPEYVFVVLDVDSGRVEREEKLLSTRELDDALRQHATPALAARLRERLASMHRDLEAGGYRGMSTAHPLGEPRVVVAGWTVQQSQGAVVVFDRDGKARLTQPLSRWQAPPLANVDFTCEYTPRVEDVGLDPAHAIVVFVVGQTTNGGDACAGATPNGDRKLHVARVK